MMILSLTLIMHLLKFKSHVLETIIYSSYNGLLNILK